MTPEERKSRIHDAVKHEIDGDKVIDRKNLGLFDELPDNIQVEKRKSNKAERGNRRDAVVSVFLIALLIIVILAFVKLLKIISG